MTSIVPLGATQPSPGPPPGRAALLITAAKVQLHEQAMGAAVAALAVPFLLLRWLAFSHIVDRLEDTGRRVQYNDDALDDTFADVAFSCFLGTLSVILLVTTTMLALKVVLDTLRYADEGPEGSGRRAERVMVGTVCVSAVIWIGDGIPSVPLWAQLAIWIASLLIYLYVARAVGAACPQPGVTWRVSAALLVGVLYLPALNFLVGRWYVDPATSDSVRLLWLLLVQPLVVEGACAPVRVLVREYSVPSAHLMLAFEAYMVCMGKLVERWMLSEVQATGLQVVAVVVISLKDVLLRKSVNARDRCFLRRSRRPARESTETLQALDATHRSLEEVGDVFATYMVGLTSLVFRVGRERKAPRAAPIVASTLLQLVAESGTEILAAGLTRSTAAADKALKLRTELEATWTRPFRVALVSGLLAPALWFVGVLMRPTEGELDVFCPWSRSPDWGWHWVPCALAKEWLGL